MTAENFEGFLEAFVSRKPFKVFTVELHNGSRFEVDHPRLSCGATAMRSSPRPAIFRSILIMRVSFRLSTPPPVRPRPQRVEKCF